MATAFFLNPEGYTIKRDDKRSTWFKAIYEFTLLYPDPLTFIEYGGNQYQSDRHFFTDMGSIPRIAQLVIPKDRCLGFYLHDSGYMDCGLWINGVFEKMTRKQVDDLLYDMCMNDPIPTWRITARTIWLAVRAFGWMSWGKGDARKGPGIDKFNAGGILRMA